MRQRKRNNWVRLVALAYFAYGREVQQSQATDNLYVLAESEDDKGCIVAKNQRTYVKGISRV